MTIRERIVRRLDDMDEAQLAALERLLEKPEYGQFGEEFRLLDELAAPMSGEDRAVFEEASRRRSLFGDRKPELKPADR